MRLYSQLSWQRGSPVGMNTSFTGHRPPFLTNQAPFSLQQSSTPLKAAHPPRRPARRWKSSRPPHGSPSPQPFKPPCPPMAVPASLTGICGQLAVWSPGEVGISTRVTRAMKKAAQAIPSLTSNGRIDSRQIQGPINPGGGLS